MNSSYAQSSKTALIVSIVVCGIVFCGVLLTANKTFIRNWHFVSPIIHTAIEIIGSVIALFVAMSLRNYQRFGIGSTFNYQISTALIAMGIIGGAHAVVPPGNTFVWLHTLATFVGGLLFLSILAPVNFHFFSSRKWWQFWMFFACSISLFFILFSQYSPVMIEDGVFTRMAATINFISGIFFCVAALKLLSIYKQSLSIFALLFFLCCFFASSAAFMFQESEIWGVRWWGWHILKVISFLIALFFIVRTQHFVLKELRIHSTNLEQKVEEKTAELATSNAELKVAIKVMETTQELLVEKEQQASQAQIETQKALDDLTLAKDSLVQTEKMASLGQLVSGVAHELNTPLGIAITANSTLQDSNTGLLTSISSNGLSKSQLVNSIKLQLKSSKMIERSLNTASNLIQNFKFISVNQHIDEKQKVNLYKYVEEITHMVKLLYKNKNVDVHLKIDQKMTFVLCPGSFNQVITNLLTNSYIHGFENTDSGNIFISIERVQESIVIDYRDDGQGISEKVKNTIFEPFVTTKKNSGSTGLGMHIVFNLITSKFCGTIECIDSIEGSHFRMMIPQ